jgi:hypothetical protein
LTPRRVRPPINCRSRNRERGLYENSTSWVQHVSRISGLVSLIPVLRGVRVNHLAIRCMSGAERERSTASIHVWPYSTPHICGFEDAAVGRGGGRGSRDGVGQQHDNPDSRLNTQCGQIRKGSVETKTGSDKRRAGNKMKRGCVGCPGNGRPCGVPPKWPRTDLGNC